LLYFGDLLEPIILIWRFQKQIPQNMVTLGHFFQKNFLHMTSCPFYLFVLFIYLFILQSGENSPPKKSLIPDV
jgi:hypothetical protein